MAFNEILVGRWNQLLTKMFSMKGGAPAPQLEPAVRPVFSIVSEEDPDLHYVRGESLCSAVLDVPGVAANQSIMQLRNPPGSGVLAIVERAIVALGAGSNIAAGVQASAFLLPILPVPGAVIFRDTRSRGTPTCTIRGQNGVAGFPAPSIFNVFANTPPFTIQPVEVILAPGFEFTVYCTGNNIELLGAIHWRERPLEASEV